MLANSWDKIIGSEMNKFHIHLWLAPRMNIHHNSLCGRNYEYFSEDPVLSGLCVYHEMKGVQSFPGLVVTLKHFFCNNQEDNRFFVNEHVSERTLRKIYLKHFQIPIELGNPYSIMTSYNLVNGYHTPNHKEILQKVVHNEWGYEGMIMTDWCITMDSTYACAKSEPI